MSPASPQLLAVLTRFLRANATQRCAPHAPYGSRVA